MIRRWWAPYYATVTTLSALIAGLLGSVYSQDIGHAFPLTLRGPWSGWSPRAIVFWCAAILFCLLFFVRQRYDDELRSELAEKTNEIRRLVQTLPPATFRATLADLFAVNARIVDAAAPRLLNPGVPVDDVKATIRSLLQSLALLASAYDGDPFFEDRRALYAANIMVFVPRSEGGIPFPDFIRERIRFLPAMFDVNSLRGVLLLRNDLAATRSDRNAEDIRVPDIALPIPNRTFDENNGIWCSGRAPSVCVGSDRRIYGFSAIGRLV
jgi:hypothetical protein